MWKVYLKSTAIGICEKQLFRQLLFLKLLIKIALYIRVLLSTETVLYKNESCINVLNVKMR